MFTPCRLAGALFLSLSLACAAGAEAAGAAQQTGPANDLEVGVAFISEGDFEAAAETLEAVTFILDGQPGRRSDLARASVYLGWALLYTDSEAAAMQRFYDARRSDPQFVPPRTQFPRRVIRLWNAAGDRGRPTCAAAAGPGRRAGPAGGPVGVPRRPRRSRGVADAPRGPAGAPARARGGQISRAPASCSSTPRGNGWPGRRPGRRGPVPRRSPSRSSGWSRWARPARGAWPST